jgi:hypothetical protein
MTTRPNHLKITNSDTSAFTFRPKLNAGVSLSAILDGVAIGDRYGHAGPYSEPQSLTPRYPQGAGRWIGAQGARADQCRARQVTPPLRVGQALAQHVFADHGRHLEDHDLHTLIHYWV